jgi:hypothetical protein
MREREREREFVYVLVVAHLNIWLTFFEDTSK